MSTDDSNDLLGHIKDDSFMGSTLGPSRHLDTLTTLLDTKDFVSGGSFIRTLCRTKPFELLGGFNSVERSCMFLPLKWS